MSDLIFYTNGEETSRIPFPTPGIKCPETKLEIKMTEQKFTLELTLDELKLIDKHLWISVATKPILEKIKNAYPPQKSPVEEAYKDWCGEYPSGGPSEDVRWGAFLAGYWVTQPKAVPVDDPPEYDEVEWDEKDNPAFYMTDEVVERVMKKWEENPPEFLKFELGKTLETLITRWWCDVFTTREDWDMQTAIDDLIDQIQLWLPREQSHEGTQDVSVIDLVDGYNDCLTKIKSKLRNKRWPKNQFN
jgi:hypothetical protein